MLMLLPKGEWLSFFTLFSSHCISLEIFGKNIFFNGSHIIPAIKGLRAAVPGLFGTRGRFCRRQVFHGQGGEDSFGMIQAHETYCARSLY